MPGHLKFDKRISLKKSNLWFSLQKWLQYQALWDLQPDHVYGRVGENISKWMSMLEEIK